MNELDAIQQQMASLGIDVSPTQEQWMDPALMGAWLSPEEEAMFAPGGAYGEPLPEEMPVDEQMMWIMGDTGMEPLTTELTNNDLWNMLSQIQNDLAQIKSLLWQFS